MTSRTCRHPLRIVGANWLTCDVCNADFLHRDDCPGTGTPECVERCANGPVPTVRPTHYEVSVLPETDVNFRAYRLFIERRSGDKWSVHDGFASLAVDGTWTEGLKSHGRDGWTERHWYDLETARSLAIAAAPHVNVNGVTAAQALAKTLASQKETTQP